MAILTSYERSFKAYEIYCEKNGIEAKVAERPILDYLMACKDGYPNNSPKEINTLALRYKGIRYTANKRALGELPDMESMVKLIENTANQVLPIKAQKLRMA